ncbi:mediator complex subunit 13 C-terminal-domain-containing protein [Truncatella angustata]|uniref:Mediator of RNA polymerase II transcription subunit 13 n=1 Tax=Truncatella angustata TaxID=152316 RepID=A0A9P8RK11_9PEZI|nr:mediator complex subunit 13 C-terminal-domain-containing protein [Truncatella angustata]KAH6647486.1 mediator complex subunit 13 C-terminal-domain-containing protein [Truncatella angustata]KAH8205392.1 hypothetical protein TruAng_000471 [Truncatella angustata]
MDTADYETNALVVNNISSIAYAFYELNSPPADFLGHGALDLEGTLRKDGYLAHIDTARRGIWCFHLRRRDAHQQQEARGFAKSIESYGYSLSMVEEGTYEPSALLKNKGSAGLNAANTPSSSSSSSSNPLDAAFRAHPPPALPGTVLDQDAKTLALADPRTPTTTTVKEAHEYLISAALSALLSAFCAKLGATPLNARTILLPQQIQGQNGLPIPILASLRVYLTTTGALVSLLSLTPVEGLISLSDSPLPPLLGITVLAAPLGMFATCQAITENEQSSSHSVLAQSPDTQVSRVRPEKENGHWRAICTKLLRAKNLPYPISGTQKWLSLQRVRRKPVEHGYDGKRTPMVNNLSPSMSWPSSLCFCKSFSKLTVNNGHVEPSAHTPNASFDPLINAKSWFLGLGEREEALAKKKQEREAAVAAAAAAARQLGPNAQPQPNSALSPIALHRPSNAGLPAGAMYPTPPDGVQTMVGFTPSMDGGPMSSPGHHIGTTAVADADTNITAAGEAFQDGWENTEVKRERGNSSFESENLFGDLGPDMFGDNDITDADFSFFDEQPGGMDLTLDVMDMTNTNSLLDMAQNFHNATVPVAKTEPIEPPPPSSAPPAPVFAKPELKDARSSLNEQPRRYTEPQVDRQSSIPTKRQASPFTPDTVFKRIRASIDSHNTAHQKQSSKSSQPGSIFDKVNFGPSLSVVNRKYQGTGRFSFSLGRDEESKPFSFNAPPTTDYLQRHGKGRRFPKDPPANVGELFARVTNRQGSASQHPSPTRFDDPASDADEVSLMSDQDDSSYESDEPSSPFKTGSLRRRRVDDDEQSLATSLRELEYLDATSPNLSVDLPRFSKSDVDLPLTRYFADAEPMTAPISLSDHDFIIAAQVLTEQACVSTLGFNAESTISLQSKSDQRRELLSITNLAMEELRSVLPNWFGDCNELSFRPFLEIPDVPLLGQPTRMQPRPPGAEQLKPSNLFQVPSPRFEMRRYDSKLSVLPSAVTFWESLGLGPSNGAKDINAVCIYPHNEGLSDDSSSFLEKMQGAYESLRLGSFDRMSASPDVPGGLLSYEVEKSGQDLFSSSILGTSLLSGLTKLSDVLSHLTVKETNFVIFFVYSNKVSGSAVESCYAFHQLFDRYKKLLFSSRKKVENEIVLQLIPMDFVASTDSLPTPTPVDYAKLAVETYDRCTLFGGPMPAPAIVLEQTIPRMIDFKLSTAPSASLLHENTCLHIAYAQSVDDRWITAAWTDNRGSQQITASYCLGRKGKAICTPFSDVAQEIWATTLEMINTWKVHWRVIITKCGIMEPVEVELWSSLAQAESKANITLTLMTVDTDPSLQLLPPEIKISSNAPAIFYTTPVSTPQASMVSPEQSGNPPTPSLRDATSAPTPGGPGDTAPESDAEATLTDITDQTWGAIQAHRLNNSSSLLDLNPAIVSGYLVKKGGAKIDDPPAVMEVNVVHNEGNPRAYETLLREMLAYFRGLGTLARARGITDKETDVRPWHIAAAENGARALYMLM